MSVLTRVPSTASRRTTSAGLLFFVLCAWSLFAGLLPAAAQSSDEALREELERVEAEQAELSASLNEATARLDDLTARMAQIRDRGDVLRDELAALEKRGSRTQALVESRIREMYKGDRSSEMLAFAAGGSLSEITARTHYVSVLARNDQRRFEEAAALAAATQARRDELAHVDARMGELLAEAEQAQSDLDARFAQAGQSYSQLQDELARREAQARRLAAEAEAKRLAAEEAASEDTARRLAEAQLAARRAAEASRSADRAREEVAAAPAPAPAPEPAPEPEPVAAPEPAADPPSSSGGSGSSGSGGSGSSGGKVCPQANPRSFTDTWGAPRSGGRTHEGTDIFGARGGDVFAIVSGTVQWTSTGSTSGLFLSLAGNDGHTYWYMHLQDFVAREGQSVQAGDLIAHNGDTGNAQGTTPHIHFEYHPGGGGPVNPYPLLKSICG